MKRGRMRSAAARGRSSTWLRPPGAPASSPAGRSSRRGSGGRRRRTASRCRCPACGRGSARDGSPAGRGRGPRGDADRRTARPRCPQAAGGRRLHRRGEPPQDDRQHRAQAQRLLHDRVGVGVLAGASLVAHPQLVGMADQALERPGEHRRGRLVAGDEQRDQLVAQLDVAQLRASSRRAASARRGCRRARRGRRRRGGGRSRRRWRRRPDEPVVAASVGRPSSEASSAWVATKRGLVPVSSSSQQLAPAGDPRRLRDPEHDAHDHLERDRLHARPQGEGLAARPALDLRAGDLAISSP